MTIPSQIRYVKYFESFLETNFYKPYLHMIPRIVKNHFSLRKENILLKFIEDNAYFISPNIFVLKEIKIGPFSTHLDLNIKICDFRFNNISFSNIEKTYIDVPENKNLCYVKIVFKEKLNIESDIKISVKGGVDFYLWANLWYSSYSCLKEFLEISKINFVINNQFNYLFIKIKETINDYTY